MKNVFGNNVSITVFGESHGPAIGVVIDGLAPGLTVDTDYINKLLTLRRPSGAISTPRQEQDEFVIESGVFNGRTTPSLSYTLRYTEMFLSNKFIPYPYIPTSLPIETLKTRMNKGGFFTLLGR